jgi:hypothetical protein
MRTTQLTKEDILSVAYDLKMDVSDERVDEILESYDDYRAGEPEEHWRIIVEIMLYDIIK